MRIYSTNKDFDVKITNAGRLSGDYDGGPDIVSAFERAQEFGRNLVSQGYPDAIVRVGRWQFSDRFPDGKLIQSVRFIAKDADSTPTLPK